MLTALTVALAAVVGGTLGLLGGGGSILLVPLLVYVAGMDTKEAIAASLVVVGVTAAGSLIGHARAGRSAGGPGCSSGPPAWRAPSPVGCSAATSPGSC